MAVDDKRAPLRFGPFEADPRSGELRRNGLRLRIQEQPFQVLLMLAERPGEVVTREELRQRLWPENTFVDFDHGLNTAINKLRDTLRDSAANPRYIETLPRRGYRFLAPVEGAGTAAATGATGAAESAPAEIAAMQSGEAPGASAPEGAEAQTLPAGLPRPHRAVPRALFGLAQAMYLVFYIVALVHAAGLDAIVPAAYAVPVLVAVYVTAPLGIALRLYMLSAVAFDYRGFGRAFARLFPAVLVLDMLWALSPFLIANKIGFGAAFAACAALLYLPFSERTLVKMAYEQI